MSTVILRQTWHEKPEPPPIPKVGPGYLKGLLARMDDRTRVTTPKGMDPRAYYTVSSAAIREVRRLNDVSVLPQVQEFLAPNKLNASLAQNLALILGALYKNTRSAHVGKVLLEFLELAEKEPVALAHTCLFIGLIPAPELREFARRQLPTADDRVESGALDILTGIGDTRDFEFIAELFRSGQLAEGGSQAWVMAVVATGKKKAIPVLKEFIDENRKSRKTLLAYASIAAQQAIRNLPGLLKYIETQRNTHGVGESLTPPTE